MEADDNEKYLDLNPDGRVFALDNPHLRGKLVEEPDPMRGASWRNPDGSSSLRRRKFLSKAPH